jgi:hypothetical protein
VVQRLEDVILDREELVWDENGKLHAHHGDVPVEIRLLKLTEEVGEVAEAFLGVHGLNKRKGVCRSRDEGGVLPRPARGTTPSSAAWWPLAGSGPAVRSGGSRA